MWQGPKASTGIIFTIVRGIFLTFDLIAVPSFQLSWTLGYSFKATQANPPGHNIILAFIIHLSLAPAASLVGYDPQTEKSQFSPSQAILLRNKDSVGLTGATFLSITQLLSELAASSGKRALSCQGEEGGAMVSRKKVSRGGHLLARLRVHIQCNLQGRRPASR